jgi:hypothetical protein
MSLKYPFRSDDRLPVPLVFLTVLKNNIINVNKSVRLTEAKKILLDLKCNL